MPAEATESPHGPSVTLLCGGFGGARFAPGLVAAVGAERSTIVTNPGDDVRYQSLEVWPDFDSVLYAVAGCFDEEQGWGIRDDTTACVDALGEDGWFRIGDRDIALSLRRTAWLSEGLGRGEVARRCRAALGVEATIVPASAGAHRTRIRVGPRWLPFQEWLVRTGAAERPAAVDIHPRATSASDEALAGLGSDLVILGPSNPLLSLMPILSTPGVAARLRRARRIVAVSPVVGGRAPRRPPEQGRHRVREHAMSVLGLPHSALGVAMFLDGLVDALVVDASDRDVAAPVEADHGLAVLTADLLAEGERARTALAREIVDFGLALPEPDAERRARGPLAPYLG